MQCRICWSVSFLDVISLCLLAKTPRMPGYGHKLKMGSLRAYSAGTGVVVPADLKHATRRRNSQVPTRFRLHRNGSLDGFYEGCLCKILFTHSPIG